MASPNDGSASALPSDDSGRYIMGGWDAAAGVWRALKVGNDRSLFTQFTKGTPNNTAVSVTTTSAQVLAANANRKVATFFNLGPATVFLKGASTASATADYPLPAGAEWVDDMTASVWHAVTASGTADLRIREIA